MTPNPEPPRPAFEAFQNRLKLCFTLPQFTDLESMASFAKSLCELNIAVAIIDPVYLCLGGKIDAANLFEMGAAFQLVGGILLKAGVTPVLVHHANRQLKVGEPMELTNLSYAGLEQYARQFILINRQSPYRGDGVHDLHVSAGGSAGHGGLWSVHIEEGTVDEQFRGRSWNVTVQTAVEARADRATQKAAVNAEKQRKKNLEDENQLLKVIDTAAASNVPRTRTYLKGRCSRLTGAVLDATLETPHQPRGSL